MRRSRVVMIAVWLLLVACGGPTSQIGGQTPTRAAPTSTARPQPTSTPRPSPTPEPLELPEEVRLALGGVRILSQDDQLVDGYDQRSASAADGLTTITAQGNWEGYWSPMQLHGQGQAALLLFQFEQDTDFIINYWSGEFGTDSFMQWGVINDDGFEFVEHGEYLPRISFANTFHFEPDTWYYALLAVDPGGQPLMLVWEKEGHYLALIRPALGQDWKNLLWNFAVSVGDGAFVIDRFDAYAFDQIRLTENTGDWEGRWWLWGISEDTYLIKLNQDGPALTSEFTINDGRAMKIEGTVYDWTSPEGETYSVMRGYYWIESQEEPDVFGYFWADWRLDPALGTIFASGHGGASMQCLIRQEVDAFPEDCFWYYYDTNQGIPADW